MTPLLTVTVTPGGATEGLLLTVAGELDLTTFTILDERLRSHAGDQRSLRIDLTGVDFIDSSGLAFLVLAHQRSEEQGVPLVVGPVSEQVAAAFRLSGLDSWFSDVCPAPLRLGRRIA